MREVQKVYRMQGVEISDKHIEVMARQMLRKVRVMDPGETDLLPGTLMDIAQFRDANEETLLNSTSSFAWYYQGIIGDELILVSRIIPRDDSCLD